MARDYYVRFAGNDYSVDPSVIGRLVAVHADLAEIVVTCAKQVVARHQRCWGNHVTVTDPAHVRLAAELRTAFQARSSAGRGPAAVTTAVGVRALGDYDTIFGLGPREATSLVALPVAP